MGENKLLSNLIFSVNMVLPIFLVLLAGWLMRRFHIISADFVKTGNSLVFFYALPAGLFMGVYTSDLMQVFDAAFVFFAIGITVAAFAVTWILAEIFVKDKTVIGTFVQGSVRGNYAILGLPLLTNLVGAEGAVKGVLVLTFVVPLYSIFSIIALSARSGAPQKVSALGLLKTVFSNHMIIGIILGAALAFFRVPLPVVVTKPIEYIAALTTPLSLICLGGSINLKERGEKMKLAAVAAALKIVVFPLIFLPLAYVVGFRGNELLTLLVMLGVPTAIASYSMAIQLKGDHTVAASTIMITTLCSVFTLTLFIYAFKTMGMIT